MITVAKYWKQWSNPHFIIMVLNNRDLNQVTWEMRAQSGDPKFEASQQIPDVSYARYADLLGLKGIFCDDPEKVASSWDEALAADRPVILEFYTDPNVPPLPPHITLKNAKAFSQSLPQDPEFGSVVVDTAKEVFATLIPSRS
jgi:pyruvate dehydrogenase (quinone)